MWADFWAQKTASPFEEAVSAFLFRWNTEIRSLAQALFYLGTAFCGVVSCYDSRIGRDELVQLFAVVLLYGGDEGKGFCAGLDVKQGLTDYEQTVPGFYHYQIKLGELEWFIAKTPQPWITLIDNVSAGGGFSLAMCSDIRVCTKTARFSCFYANVGIGGCDMSSSYFLPRLIGTGRAYEMMLTGNFINADEAWNLGLVSKVVDERKDLVPAGLELARVIAAKDPMAVRLTKEAMRANVDASGFDNALQVENRNQTLMIAHNVNKDASQDPIGKYWIEDRTDPMNPKGAN